MNRSVTLEIEKIVYGGRGLGRVQGKVVFVPFTAPGDVVQVELTREKKNFAEGALQSIRKPSSLRTQPFCNLFGKCGGCHYQHLPYPEQLKVKEATLRESLYPLIANERVEIRPTLASPQDRGYRIRAQFKGVREKEGTVLGFYGLGTHRLVEIKECPLLHPRVNRILERLREQARKHSIRGANIQVSRDEEKGVIGLEVAGKGGALLAEKLAGALPEVKGLVLEGRQKTSWGELDLEHEWPEMFGKPGLNVRCAYDSFSQVNPYQNWNLMEKVVEWAELTGQEMVVDLYCGSGNLTLPLARQAGSIWGVDDDKRAIAYGIENARKNGLQNCRFIPASVEAGLQKVRQEGGLIDVAVLDPPRAGARDLQKLVLLQPRKILYVSCEPPTLARDLTRLRTLGYRLSRVQALDMFPHTYHLEVIAELTKGSKDSRVQGVQGKTEKEIEATRTPGPSNLWPLKI